MTTKTVGKPVEEVKVTTGCNRNRRCPDYDSECVDVENPTRCFIGINKYGLDIGNADGFCPLIHTNN